MWPKGVTLAGGIVDASGTPIAGARLSASVSWRGSQATVQVRADSQGHFSFRHLAPGPWVITGDVRSGQRGTLDVDGTTNRDGLRLVTPKPKGN